MKEELHMSYRKMKQNSPGTNSDLNRVLRQQWALKYLRSLKAE